MTKNTQPKQYKLIYNPHAGEKRGKFTPGKGVSLEDIKSLLKRYQIEVDYAPTKRPGHATELAKEAIAEGYHTVLVVGGDGTVGETANGLIGSDVTLGIIPMGTFMNIARMLSISTEIENAILLLKIGRKRKIDVGVITKLDGEKLAVPHYFIETVGVGLEAEIQKTFKSFERGDISALWKIIKLFLQFYANKVTIKTDTEEIVTKATLITIANGPYTGAALHLAPDAKLNDHRLTITLYPMTKFELITYFLRMKFTGKVDKRRLRTIQTTVANITSAYPVAIHADATVFSETPVELKVQANALQVIYGFPAAEDESSLRPRTKLDP